MKTNILILMMIFLLALTACGNGASGQAIRTSGDGLADLYIQRVSWTPQNPVADQPVSFSIIVANKGTESAQQSVVGFRSTLGDRSGEVYTIPRLSPDETYELMTNAIYSAGRHELTVVADFEKSIRESSEDNNVLKNIITVSP